jgi:hypothetical protein
MWLQAIWSECQMIIDLEAAKARLAKLDAEREPLLALIQAAEAYESAVGKSLFHVDHLIPKGRIRASAGGGRASPVMNLTVEAVSSVLEALGPTTTGDLVALLADKQELGLSAPNANNILSARLSNSEKFVTRRAHGWWFKDRPWPTETTDDGDEENGSEPMEPQSFDL